MASAARVTPGTPPAGTAELCNSTDAALDVATRKRKRTDTKRVTIDLDDLVREAEVVSTMMTQAQIVGVLRKLHDVLDMVMPALCTLAPVHWGSVSGGGMVPLALCTIAPSIGVPWGSWQTLPPCTLASHPMASAAWSSSHCPLRGDRAWALWAQRLHSSSHCSPSGQSRTFTVPQIPFTQPRNNRRRLSKANTQSSSCSSRGSGRPVLDIIPGRAARFQVSRFITPSPRSLVDLGKPRRMVDVAERPRRYRRAGLQRRNHIGLYPPATRPPPGGGTPAVPRIRLVARPAGEASL